MTSLLPFRAKRFVAVAFCSVIVPFAIVFSGVLFTDWDTSTFYGDACFIIFLLAEWPLALGTKYYPNQDPPTVVICLLCIITGLFWASIVDVIIVLRKRYVA